MYEEDCRDLQKCDKVISIGLPKGNVFDKSKEIVEKFTGSSVVDGKLKIEYKNYRFYFLKHRDIPFLVENGKLDYGITSDEWIAETGVAVARIKELDWCNTQIALIKSKNYVGDLLNCVTEFENIAKKYFENSVQIERISGSSEALIPEIYNCCIDCVESGKTLKVNDLVVEDVIFNSKIVLIGKTKRTEAIENILKYI